MKKTYVLDTSVFLSDFRSIFSYSSSDIIIPLIVLEEIDKHKKRIDSVGINARGIIRILDLLRDKGSLQNGVRLRKGSGMVFVKNFDSSLLPLSLESHIPDHQIICTVLTEKSIKKQNKIILVSCDINMRVKADALGILVEDYTSDHIVKERDQIYTGFSTILVDDQLIDRLYLNESIFLSEVDLQNQKFSPYPNQFLMLLSSSNQKKSALVRFVNKNSPLRKIKEYDNILGVITAKNKEQSFALDLLMDPNVPVVSLIGSAGTGKTILSIAAGLQQIITPPAKYSSKQHKLDNQIYSRLIVSRPIQPLGKDIGFLPGSLEEKMAPWLAPIEDNLKYLFANDRLMLEEYTDKGIIEIEALTYIRGRSIQNAFIILDETQNLNRHEMKTILTRVGNGSKIVLTGDIEQIDNVNVDETSNGLTHAIEKFKDYDLAGHITLTKGERSNVATLSAQIL